MGTEIERKFLVKNDGWRASATARSDLRQGYLATGNGNTIRIRTTALRTPGVPSHGRRRDRKSHSFPAGASVIGRTSFAAKANGR